MPNKAIQKHNKSKRTLLLTGLAGATLALTGCPALFVGGVAMGVMTAVDRRSTGVQVDDKAIELRGLQEIAKDLGEKGHVNVTSYNRQVLLTGEVPTEADKAAAQAAVARVANVRHVVNMLAIGPNTSMGVRSNDTYLTGKVKAALTSAKEISSLDVKVTTERAAVYLMGMVTAYEANIASDVASRVPGVKKVVRVFEIITQAEVDAITDQVTPVEPESVRNNPT